MPGRAADPQGVLGTPETVPLKPGTQAQIPSTRNAAATTHLPGKTITFGTIPTRCPVHEREYHYRGPAADGTVSSSATQEAEDESEDGDEPLPPCEPFKIKMVEQIRLLPRQQRRQLMQQHGHNVFNLHAEDVYIDLLTDSGTSAMSDTQWGSMIAAPQAYAGSGAFYALQTVVQDLFTFKHVLPEHQGRAAENILFSVLVAPRVAEAAEAGSGAKVYVPNNVHFDTTEANVLRCGGVPVNLVVPDAYETGLASTFKGNMDIKALEAFLDEHRGCVPVVMLTITNNGAGGQPVSMDNIRQVSELAHARAIPFFLDAARFAENAAFIQHWEPGYEGKGLRDIVREMFSYADGCTFSGKKEALANAGGLLCCNDDALHEQLRNLTIVVEGFPTYGGLACRDMQAMAQGLMEVTEQGYQEYRHRQVELLASLLRQGGVPLVEPPGGHAVYIDAGRFLPHIPPHHFPAQALTAALYERAGVRAVEIGSSCFGRVDEATGRFVPARLELMRLALPRRVYTDGHLAYVAEALCRLYKKRESIHGLRRVYAAKLLSHFTARFEPLESEEDGPNADAVDVAAAAGVVGVGGQNGGQGGRQADAECAAEAPMGRAKSMDLGW